MAHDVFLRYPAADKATTLAGLAGVGNRHNNVRHFGSMSLTKVLGPTFVKQVPRMNQKGDQ
jgi:hypothetical protein